MIKNIIFDFGGVIIKHRSTIMEEFISKMFDIPIDKARELGIKTVLFRNVDQVTGKLEQLN